MASIRRTLSLVARPVSSVNGEACGVASPLSRSSATPTNQVSSGGAISPLMSLLDSLALMVGLSPQRSSRPFERSKPKGQNWRKAILHLFIFFTLGMFIGVSQFASMSGPTSSIQNHDGLSVEMIAADISHYQSTDAKLAPHSEELELGRFTAPVYTVNSPIVEHGEKNGGKLLIVATPTQTEALQAYYLNRLANTLKLVSPPLLWIVVEMTSQSPETANILRKTGLTYRHLVCSKNLSDIVDRKIHQRNVAVAHIETHHLDGILYFADQNGVYSVNMFEQMRQIRRFGTWMTAAISADKGSVLLEGAICNGTNVMGWHTDDKRRGSRRFYADLVGIALNSTMIWDLKRWHRPTLEPIRQIDALKDGKSASSFIEQIMEDESQMECSTEYCSSITAWHSYADMSSSSYPRGWTMKQNLDVIVSLS
ncbi:hypothetical protein MLD38_006039 [Melastoma candidum]|uniref:Uncharacterized protein n=1 Tax=Melastoma candidum TaxID=119954 RepID=A0ACB9RMV1_9MYRT|nr:hypothetical protein MLD38_006039 [Melastoma candidum]